MFVIEDEAHSEGVGRFATHSAAVAELRRLASLTWDEEPNLPPCMSWKTCGRRYELIEYDTRSTPWLELSRTPALNISATSKEWLLPA